MKEFFGGQLLALWTQLQAALNKDNWALEQEKAVGKFNVSCKDIGDAINWFKDCTMDKCGISCNYCDKLSERLLAR